MSISIKSAIGIFIIIVGVVSCTKQNEEFFIDKSVNICDTSNIKFSQSVFPIIQAHCFICHANGVNLGNVVLENYSQIKFQAVESDLLQVINHTSGFSQMPLGAPKLSACDIAKITAWVKQGAPNN